MKPLPDQSSTKRLPNLQWGWRMPVRRLSWKFAWWLMRRVTMRDYTPHQQASMIHDALGAYRPLPKSPITGTTNYTMWVTGAASEGTER